MGTNPILTSLIVSGVLGVISFLLHRGARSSTPDNKTFGGFYLGFTIATALLAVFLCFAIKPLREAISGWVDRGLSIEAPKDEPPVTLGSPLDYVTWEGDTLRRSAKALPKGWRAAFTTDPNVAGLVIMTDMPRKLEPSVGRIYVYLDPDLKTLPNQRPTAPEELLRPKK